jgi:hypothetical protein
MPGEQQPNRRAQPNTHKRRRAFPPDCFQLLPLEHVVSRSFEDIVGSGVEIQAHDKELLRDQGSTLFIRQGTSYGLSRFLGILVCTVPFPQTPGLI